MSAAEPIVAEAARSTARLEGLAPDAEHAQLEVIPPPPAPEPGTQPFDLAGPVGAAEFHALAAQARLLHMSGAAPKPVRENIYVAFHLAMAGRDYGISPTAALDLIDVISLGGNKGYQLSPSPQLLNGQIERLGLGKIAPFIRTRERCVAVALEPGGRVDVRCRATWPEHHTDRDGQTDCVCVGVIGDSEFTWEDAIIATLVQPDCLPGKHTIKCINRNSNPWERCNQGYVTYPQRMMWWRAAGFCADDYFPQASLGRYTPEALEAIIDVDGRAVDPATIPVPDGYEPEPTAAERRAAAEATPEAQAELAEIRTGLQARIRALPEGLRHELAEWWKDNPRVQAYRIDNLPKAESRLVASLLAGLETKAKAAGWAPEPTDAADDAAETGAESPQEPPAPPTPTPPPDSPGGDESPPDPANVDGTLPFGDDPPQLGPPRRPRPDDLEALGVAVRAAIKPGREERASGPTCGAVSGILADWGIVERDDRLATLATLLGRTLTTSTEMTKGEAGAIIDTAPPAPPLEPARTGNDLADDVVNRVRAMSTQQVRSALAAADIKVPKGSNARLQLALHLFALAVGEP